MSTIKYILMGLGCVVLLAVIIGLLDLQIIMVHKLLH